MKKFTLPLLVASVVILIVACSATDCIKGSGNMTSEDRNVSGYSKLDVGGCFEVKITQGNTESLRIEAEDNIIKHVVTEVQNGVLHIHLDKSICKVKELIVFVNVKTLDAIKASGAAEIKTTNQLNNSDKFDLKISGAGEADMDIETKLLTTKISGAGELKLKGKADTHAVDISGAGEVNAYNFMVNKYALDLSGASECFINVSEELSVTASGASEVNYKGNPTKVSKETSGASEINKVN